MSQTFPKLIEEFNEAAMATAKQEKLPIPVLVAHYKTSMRHGTADMDERRNLTDIMFRLTHGLLDSYASPSMVHTLVGINVKAKMTPMLEALCAPESIDFLPPDAGKKLAAIVMRASVTAAKTGYEQIQNGMTSKLTAFRPPRSPNLRCSMRTSSTHRDPRPASKPPRTSRLSSASR